MTRHLTAQHRGHADLLRWHLATRERDSGLRSSHGALVAMIETGAGGSYSDGQAGHAARLDANRHAQAKHKLVEEALARMTGALADVLRRAYGPHVLLNAPPLAWMGDAGPVAAVSSAAASAYGVAVERAAKRRRPIEPSVWGWLLTLDRKRHATTLGLVEAEARELLRAAHDALVVTVAEMYRAAPRSAGKAILDAFGGEPKRRSRAVTKRVTAETFCPVWA